MKLYTSQWEIDHAFIMDQPFKVWATPQPGSDVILDLPIAPSTLVKKADIPLHESVEEWVDRQR